MKLSHSVLLTGVLALNSVAATQAATVRLEGDPNGGGSTIIYVGDDASRLVVGGVNNVKVSFESFELTGRFPDGYYVEDKAGVTAGAGCIQQSKILAICGRGGMPAQVRVNLKGGNDIFTPVPFTFSELVFGKDPLMVVNGGSGDDTINGNESNDSLNGGDGNDTINGRGGNDVIRGNSGDDNLQGAENDDRIFGDNGRDTISGGPGKDSVSAGADNDFVSTGDKEIDNVQCGLGVDRVKIEQDFGLDIFNPDCEDLFN